MSQLPTVTSWDQRDGRVLRQDRLAVRIFTRSEEETRPVSKGSRNDFSRVWLLSTGVAELLLLITSSFSSTECMKASESSSPSSYCPQEHLHSQRTQ
ncbi:uncharacterized protein LOC104861631 isoform X2 [Fukomys damarensis]|uniref:uncharacterized protein LOC104861631 isoform X2 n=1 Tax=Fukomys damarensis TaxID=885580 RepID=UPI0005400553|nr:uncharacterized protein LOC104861631 isoform X2 [Fukomys damarensis]